MKFCQSLRSFQDRKPFKVLKNFIPIFMHLPFRILEIIKVFFFYFQDPNGSTCNLFVLKKSSFLYCVVHWTDEKCSVPRKDKQFWMSCDLVRRDLWKTCGLITYSCKVNLTVLNWLCIIARNWFDAKTWCFSSSDFYGPRK